MYVVLGLLSIFGFSAFLIWLIVNAIRRKKKVMPLIGVLLSFAVFVWAGTSTISEDNAASNNKSETGSKLIKDAYSELPEKEIDGILFKNVKLEDKSPFEKNAFYAILSGKIINTSDKPIKVTFEYGLYYSDGRVCLASKTSIKTYELKPKEEAAFSEVISSSVANPEKVTKFKILNINKQDINSSNNEINEKNETSASGAADNFKLGMEAFNNQEYEKAMEYFALVKLSDPNYNKAIEYAAMAYQKMPIDNETVSKNAKFEIGKWYVVDLINYKLNSVKVAESLNGRTPASGNLYLIVDITVKNMTGNTIDGYGTAQNISINSKSNFRLYNREGYTYKEVDISDHPMNGVISSGSEFRGELVYEIPLSEGYYYFDVTMNNFSHKMAFKLK